MKPSHQLCGLVAMGTLLVACQAGPEQAPTPEPPPVAKTTAATPASPTQSPEPSFSPEKQPIYQALKKYWNAREDLFADPESSDVQELAEATAPQAFKIVLQIWDSLLKDEIKYRGREQYKKIKIAEPEIIGDMKTVATTYCRDVTGVEILDLKSGQVKEVDGRNYYIHEEATLQFDEKGGWVVSYVDNEKVSQC